MSRLWGRVGGPGEVSDGGSRSDTDRSAGLRPRPVNVSDGGEPVGIAEAWPATAPSPYGYLVAHNGAPDPVGLVADLVLDGSGVYLAAATPNLSVRIRVASASLPGLPVVRMGVSLTHGGQLPSQTRSTHSPAEPSARAASIGRDRTCRASFRPQSAGDCHHRRRFVSVRDPGNVERRPTATSSLDRHHAKRGVHDPQVICKPRADSGCSQPRSARHGLRVHATGYGCDAVRVKDLGEIKAEAAKAWAKDVPTVLEIPISREVPPLI